MFTCQINMAEGYIINTKQSFKSMTNIFKELNILDLAHVFRTYRI